MGKASREARKAGSDGYAEGDLQLEALERSKLFWPTVGVPLAPQNRISSRVATVLSNQSYGDDYGIERFLTGFHLILVRLVSMGDVLRHVATKVLEPRLFRLQSFRRRKSLSWNCWNFCMLGDLWSLFACHFGSTAWGFRCFKVVGGETAELRTPCASWGLRFTMVYSSDSSNCFNSFTSQKCQKSEALC